MSLFSIYDGRSMFWQWDLNRKLIVNEDTCSEVHFCNGTDECSLVCSIYNLDGQRVVDVPNVLLHSALPISVFVYIKDSDGAYTKRAALFNVHPRTRPADYIYTETEVKNLESLERRIQQLEQLVLPTDLGDSND